MHSNHASVVPAKDRKLIPPAHRDVLKRYSAGRGNTWVLPHELLDLIEKLSMTPVVSGTHASCPAPGHVVASLLRSIHTRSSDFWPRGIPVFRVVDQVNHPLYVLASLQGLLAASTCLPL